MNLQQTLAAIPYLPFHNVTVSVGDGGQVIARMPFHREVTNYVGTVHAGAIFTLAETAAGVAASGIVPGDRSFVLLRGAVVGYTRRAEGDLVATASISPTAAKATRGQFDSSGRADADVLVSIIDPEGEQVFQATFDYALRKVKS